MRTTVAPSLMSRGVASGKASSAGDGALRVERVRGRSEVICLTARSPLKLLAPRARSDPDGAAHVVISSYGGGLVSGDGLRLDVQIGPGARCRLSTQASTKIYRRTDAGGPCRQALRTTLGAGALLAVVPDPITCFAGAAYEQSQHFELAAGASLLMIDWMTSGRWACGERWVFDSYRGHTEIAMAGRRVWLDALRLDATAGPIGAPHRCGRFNCFATAVLVGPAMAVTARDVLAQLHASRPGRCAELIAAASPLADGAVLRVAGMGSEPVGRFLVECLASLAASCGAGLWDRKW